MKKLHLLIVLSLCALTAMAQNGRIDLRQESKAEIVKNDFSSLRATFSYGSIESIEVPSERGTFSEIAIEGTYAAGEIGAPELPATHQLLAVPFGATPHVSVTNYTTTDYRLSDYGINTLVPHQASVRKDQRPEDIEFAYNASAYQTRSLATAPEATIEVQGTLRGIQIGSLVINPVSYNPAANTLRVFNNIEVEVSFDGADLQETERMLLSTYSPYFDIVYKQMFNYRAIQSVYDDHPDLMAYPVHMIVVTPQNYVSALQPWIDWKVQKGFDVSVYTTAQTGSTYAAIRNYIQNLYNTGVSQGKTPTFLVLVGDVAQIPSTTGSSTEKVTDLYYGTVDNDYFPDMFYSRMSAENTSQLTAIVNKILQYEKYTMPDPSYLNNVTFIAGWDDFWTDYVGKPTIQYAMQYYYNAAHGFTNVYNWLGQPYTNCYASLSSGTGFVNYTAHGNDQMWADPWYTNNDVNQLTNTNKYFLAMGNCCLSGNFGYNGGPCFGEAMLRGVNKAAYSYIGSCPNTYWYEDYYFGVGATNTFGQMPNINNTATGVYDAVWMDNTYNTVSSMTFLGNIAVCYAHAGNYTTSVTPTYYWQAYHVLGDGSIMPYRVQPTANNVTHASSISVNATSFTVNAQAGSYVGISQNSVLKGAALVPSSGTVNVPVSGITAGQQVRIVVTKPQRQPYIQDINVSGGVMQYTVTVTPSPAVSGNVAINGRNDREAITYDFEDDFAAQDILYWTVIDADGDGFNWYIRPTVLASLGHNDSQGFVTSASYQGEVALTPDNYLVSPQGQYSSISFWACAQDAGWPQEHFGVAVSTTNNTSASAFTTIQEWDMTAKATRSHPERGTNDLGTYYEYTVDLSAYAGQNIYVAIRHFNCTDWFRLNVDDITLNTGPSGGSTSAVFNQGASCTVTATANSGYNFVNWTENGTQVSTNANYTFTVNGNRNLVANFQVQPQQYTVSVTASPSNGGNVTGGGTYVQGSSCTVHATANNGYNFVNWTENGTQVSTNANYTFTVNGNRNLVANFQAQPQQYAVSVTASPSNGGNVTGGGTYVQGTSCTVHATANNGYNFVNWTENGTQVSTNANYTFTVNGNRNLVANFQAQPQQYAVSVTASPSNGGNVTGGGTYVQGSSCTVHATANNGYNFVNWTENGTQVSTNANYTFTVNGNRNLVANFQVQSFTISATATPNEGGSVTGGGTYNYNASCTLRATPSTGYNFVNWTKNGVQVSTNSTYSFTVTESATYTAHFIAQSYTITVAANPSNAGSVSGGGSFTYGQTCTVNASANEGYTFTNWTENGASVTAEADYSFTVTGNRNLVANFSQNTYTIQASAGENGSITPSGTITVTYGESQSFSMDPDSDYEIQDVLVDGNSVGAVTSYTFTNVTASHTIHVSFAQLDGLDESNRISPVVYPNPTDGEVIVSCEGLSHIRIMDAYGKTVYNADHEGGQAIIDLSQTAKGIYLMHIEANGSRAVRKIVVE